ncbi:hypothetical protein QO239_23650 [Cupriavidus taiwanensis]|uniref:hypothetical protein n=1 Tax=Cupriavidus taiwanensis TaxID=164546 RepID=UPI002541F7AA|nr:hypothetical protein [Cupriavidus taiwanensis]MDK3025594.1 hypothetical protein [Cupriavidus taiwanensis]
MEWDDEVWASRHQLLCRCWISRIYHQKRERFYDMCDALTKAISVIGGTAAVSKLAGADFMVLAGAAITVTSTASLVLGYAKKARSHADLAKAFTDLEARIVGKGVFDEAQANAFQAEIVKIEIAEPRSLGALVRICQNELAFAQGHPDMVKPVRLWQRLFAHFYDFDLSAAPRIKS